MARTTVLAQRRIEGFALSQTYGVPASVVIFGDAMDAFTIEVGKAYVVSWEGKEYNVTAQDVNEAITGALVLGNASAFGFAGNGEPFAIGWTVQGVTFLDLSEEGAASYTVGIYEEAQEEVSVPSATVKLKGYSGAEFTYENVPKIWLAAPESTEDNPVLVPFTYGEAVDGVEVIPDFSAGDQTVTVPEGYLARSAVLRRPESLIPGNIKAGETVAGIIGDYDPMPGTEELMVPADFSAGDMVLKPSEGKYLTKATVQKPETLIPENVAEGVDIAGIVGTLLTGSGANIVIASGSFTDPAVNGTIISHGLGVTPDIVIVYTGGYTNVSATDVLKIYIGVSTAFGKTINDSFVYLVLRNRYATVSGGYKAFRETLNVSTGAVKAYVDSTTSHYTGGLVYLANSETFKVPASQYDSAMEYKWFAIGGLT